MRLFANLRDFCGKQLTDKEQRQSLPALCKGLFDRPAPLVVPTLEALTVSVPTASSSVGASDLDGSIYDHPRSGSAPLVSTTGSGATPTSTTMRSAGGRIERVRPIHKKGSQSQSIGLRGFSENPVLLSHFGESFEVLRSKEKPKKVSSCGCLI